MTDQPTQKLPDCEMTQLEAMEEIQNLLDKALPLIATASNYYKKYLSTRRFANKEIALLLESYNKIITVWNNMRKRKKREEKNVRS